MNVLLVGGAGYIGRVVTNYLRGCGYDTTVADLFKFSQPNELRTTVEVKIVDTRELVVADFAGVDMVVDLAAISNDPAGDLNPELTRTINAVTRARTARLAREAGVRRYVLFSSCSVYGATDELVNETSPVNPLTEYAACNLYAEREILDLAGPDFCATALRLATVFGLSPSMRFDLVVNTMTLGVHDSGRITVTGGGDQYRPVVHVADVAEAVRAVLEAPTAVVNGEVYNVVHTSMSMREVAAAVVRGVNRPVEVVVCEEDPDRRNYRVDGTKLAARLGFTPARTVEAGAETIFDALTSGVVSKLPWTIRLNGYREMVARLVS